MNAIDDMQPQREQQSCMLQVALAPSAITRRVIDQRRWQFFIAASQLARQIHAPSRATHERGLDKIMTQNRPAQRLLSRQFGQTTMLPKRPNPNNRIVTPIICRTTLPKIQSGDEYLAIGV